MTLGFPLTLHCGTILPNRLAKSAMAERLADTRNRPTPEHNALYRQWSLGGAGLLITGNIMVDSRYLTRAGDVVLENAASLPRISHWVTQGTQGDNQLWAQVTHPGRQCSRLINSTSLSASDIQPTPKGYFARPRAMQNDEIQDVIERFAHAAKLAQEGGFTGVQIQGADGHLVNQFLSPSTNHRQDQWGGSLINRSRLLLVITDAIREAIGSNFPLSVKLNATDVHKNGLSWEELLQIITWLQERGVDVIEISSECDGLHSNEEDEKKIWERANSHVFRASDTTGKTGKAPHTAFMITGNWPSLEAMNQSLSCGQTQLIGMTSPFCVDPEFPTKIFAGIMQRPPLGEKHLSQHPLFGGKTLLSQWMKLLYQQGQRAWYHQQIINLSRCKQPDFNLSLTRAFIREMLNETRLIMQHRYESGTSEESPKVTTLRS